MFTFKHYVPILKAKMGEFKAIQRLPPEISDKITPFFDIPRQDVSDSKTFDGYLSQKAVHIHKAVGSNQHIFVDFFDIDLDKRISDGQHFIEFTINELRKLSVKTIPVLGLDRDVPYLDSIKNTLNLGCESVCFRLQNTDIENPTSTEVEITNILKNLNILPRQAHLLLDFRNIDQNDLEQKIKDTLNFLVQHKNITQWLTLIIAASAFPENMSSVEKHSLKFFPRIEFSFWKNIISQHNQKKIVRCPSFSDYGICHPDLLDFRPVYNPSANIRYTLNNCWLVLKEAGLKRKINKRTVWVYSQFHTLSRRLCSDQNFFGPDYSYGDMYIYECARRTQKPGNLTTWREVGTNHHITLVVNQISNLS